MHFLGYLIVIHLVVFHFLSQSNYFSQFDWTEQLGHVYLVILEIVISIACFLNLSFLLNFGIEYSRFAAITKIQNDFLQFNLFFHY